MCFATKVWKAVGLENLDGGDKVMGEGDLSDREVH